MNKLYLLLLFITNISFSQKEFNLDNSITCNTTQVDNVRNIGLIYSGSNTLVIKKNNIDLNSIYNYLTNTQNEFNQRINISHKFNKQQIFLTYQFNSSYIRNINTDNWIGIGYGFKQDINKISYGLSYATVYQETIFYNNQDISQLRHSFRGKIKYDGIKLGIQCEYWYQPSYQDIKDYIINGNTKISILPKNDINFIIQDILSYNSINSIKIIHNISFGIQYKLDKKF